MLWLEIMVSGKNERDWVSHAKLNISIFVQTFETLLFF